MGVNVIQCGWKIYKHIKPFIVEGKSVPNLHQTKKHQSESSMEFYLFNAGAAT